MSTRQNSVLGSVLHIRPDWADKVAGIDALLKEASFELDICPDVYRGLARLYTPDRRTANQPSLAQPPSDESSLAQSPSAGPGMESPPGGEAPHAPAAATPKAYHAVVVCVDDLGPAELEFFAILSRGRRRLPVLVYGQERYNFRLAKAIELGAKGPMTIEAVRALSAELGLIAPPPTAKIQTPLDYAPPSAPAEPVVDEVPPARPQDRLVEPPLHPIGGHVAEPGPPVMRESDAAPAIPDEEPTAPDEKNAAAEERGPAVSDEAGAAPDELEANTLNDERLESEGGHSPDRRARVPWQTYSDRPVRRGPSSAPPSRGRPTSEPTRPEPEVGEQPLRSGSSQPLLTEDELQALLGDDISALAPDERLNPASEESQEEDLT